ncbi:hypothetical protein Misp01_34100 [Microtetraspora sp. NBRC 13810]|uniref:SpoIIE family protein phosphatase n=1 Tax=Microtetraspora sp. NBRC 13810 TaxID=3030990 RepID=UPI0024A54DD2|nr:SpoIIE family protein phosphatase [Microtetraspora sp. NBRC 13810]GLW08280.1 hypothetical protein Misp01_34100 [Microtetraspora sp. NBRC 13810]
MLRDALFAGEGEMARYMREHDWTGTPLGPPEGWPDSLKIAVRIVLGSRVPMFVFWGKELYQFYNDAYRPILGENKHPQALVQPAAECWSEIWDVVGPMFTGVLATGRANYVEDHLLWLRRGGFVEETFFTFSHSPAPDDDGTVGGVFCACFETTRRVQARRRLQLVRDVAERAGEGETPQDACLSAVHVVEDSPDLPFVLLFRVSADDSAPSELIAASGVECAGDPQALCDPAGWPLAEVAAAQAGRTVDRLGRRTRGWVAPGVVGDPKRARVLPLPGQGDDGPLVMVAGLSPNAAFDADYRGFVDLFAETVAAAAAKAQARRDAVGRAEALSQIDHAKTVFFSDISHEFRTPLTLMLGPLQQVLARMAEDDPDRSDLEVVEHSALRMLRLVNTLLDFSRIEAGRMSASFEPVDVSTVTAELAGMFRSAAEEAGLDLVVDCPALPPDVYVDPGLWEKIILNLLSNALKHTGAGRVSVSVRLTDRHCRLVVADTGAGIPPEEVPHVFERFHQVRNPAGRAAEGSGIGLALVRDLVELHGGEVVVASALGRGSTFTVTLPRGHAHLPPGQVREHTSRVSFKAMSAPLFVAEIRRWLADEGLPILEERMAGMTPQPALEGPGEEHILIVDDSADMCSYLQRILGEHWRTSAVGGAREALDLIRAGDFCLVLVDVTLPGMDGLDLVRELRADPLTETLPVVLLSARAGEEAAVEGLSCGADDYLIKPFSSAELLARIGSHLVMAKLRRTAAIQLDASEQRFRLMSDAAPVLMWATDTTGGCDFVNRAWLDYTGRLFHEELADGWADGVHPDDKDAACELYQEGFAQRRPFDVEYRHRRADGSYGWLHARGVPRVNGDGVFCGFIGACTDITERKKNEARHRILGEVTAGLDAGDSLAERLSRTGAILVPAFADRCTLEVAGPDGRPWQLLHARADGGRAEVEVPDEVLDRWLEADSRSAEAARPPVCGTVPNAIISPITVQGRVLGALTLVGTAGRPAYDREDRVMSAELARRLALHLDYARLLHVERVARRSVELAAARTSRLQEITAGLSGALTAEQVADVIVGHAERVLGAATLVAMPDSGRVLKPIAVAGPARGDGWAERSPAEAGQVMADRQPLWQVEVPEEPGGRGVAVLPMAVGSDSLGVLVVRLPGDRLLTPEEQEELAAIAGLGACALQRAGRFDIEHQLAATLQRSLLPDRLPNVPGISSWATYCSATSETTIGGDWYDLIPLEDDRVALVIGDVSGHGVAAAAVMGQIRSGLSAYLLEGHDPGQALARTARMAEALEPELMVTACCAVLHLETGTLMYANAGHPPPIVRHPDGTVGYLSPATSPPLGITAPDSYTACEERLAPGSTLVLYTDGLVERRGEPIDTGLQRLAERLGEFDMCLPQLGQLLLAFVGSERNDDTALLLVRTSGAPLTLHIDYPADSGSLAELRRTLADWLRTAHLSDLEEFEFLLACSEAVSNAAEHGYAFAPGTITVDGRITAGQVMIRVADQGGWQDQCFTDRGRGIPLMRAVMDVVTIDANETGTTVEMRRRLRRKELS